MVTAHEVAISKAERYRIALKHLKALMLSVIDAGDYDEITPLCDIGITLQQKLKREEEE